ncbi:MAG TPA: methyltransferase domain-containing protein, partial [Kofleriaceae bacterium]|nr:methyltransferase domain-containing protein [Kofleriaceae bacterium]
CLTAANQCPTSIFEGVDFRKRVVEIATGLAQQLGLQNASFIHADAFALDWSKYDGFYFFNPFAEQLYHGFLFLDHTIEFDPAKYVQFVLAVRARLADARIGTRVVTYHGFGGSTPSGYELVSDQVVGTDRIELWEKVRPTYRIMIDDEFAEAV